MKWATAIAVVALTGIGLFGASLVNEIARGDEAMQAGQFSDAVQAYNNALGLADPEQREILAGLLYKKARALRGNGTLLLALAAVKQAQFYSDHAAFDSLRKQLETMCATAYVARSSEIVEVLEGAQRGFRVAANRQLDLWVSFDTDSTRLTEQGRLQASELAAAFNSPQLQKGHFVLVGHTDIRGTAAYNMDLSVRRARSLRDHLVSRHGASRSQIQIEGRGENEPLDRGTSPAAHARNRRVELLWISEAP